MRKGGEDVDKERSTAVGAIGDCQRICAFNAKEKLTDGGCSFMNANGSCTYAHIDMFGRTTKKGR